MLIGILQTGRAPDALQPVHGDYPDLFIRLLAKYGFEFKIFEVLEGDVPADPALCDGWLITGSRFGAYEDHPWIPPLEAFIRAVRAADVPMVGICFGHQIIAQALGGKVEKYKGGWSVGPTEYQWGDQTIRLNAWHQDQVTQLPDGAEVCATNGHCGNAALIYGNTIFTVQAHPEFHRDFAGDIIEKRGRGLIDDALLDAAKARLDLPLDDQRLAAGIAQFFKTREIAL